MFRTLIEMWERKHASELDSSLAAVGGSETAIPEAKTQEQDQQRLKEMEAAISRIWDAKHEVAATKFHVFKEGIEREVSACLQSLQHAQFMIDILTERLSAVERQLIGMQRPDLSSVKEKECDAFVRHYLKTVEPDLLFPQGRRGRPDKRGRYIWEMIEKMQETFSLRDLCRKNKIKSKETLYQTMHWCLRKWVDQGFLEKAGYGRYKRKGSPYL